MAQKPSFPTPIAHMKEKKRKINCSICLLYLLCLHCLCLFVPFVQIQEHIGQSDTFMQANWTNTHHL
jgi:hypothetical protein